MAGTGLKLEAVAPVADSQTLGLTAAAVAEVPGSIHLEDHGKGPKHQVQPTGLIEGSDMVGD